MSDEGEEVFWKAVRAGYSYEAALAKQRQAEDEALREVAEQGKGN